MRACVLVCLRVPVSVSCFYIHFLFFKDYFNFLPRTLCYGGQQQFHPSSQPTWIGDDSGVANFFRFRCIVYPWPLTTTDGSIHIPDFPQDEFLLAAPLQLDKYAEGLRAQQEQILLTRVKGSRNQVTDGFSILLRPMAEVGGVSSLKLVFVNYSGYPQDTKAQSVQLNQQNKSWIGPPLEVGTWNKIEVGYFAGKLRLAVQAVAGPASSPPWRLTGAQKLVEFSQVGVGQVFSVFNYCE